MAEESDLFRSPIPVPQFYEDRRSSISKKVRTSTPCDRRMPPKPPSKSIPSVSRLFQNQSFNHDKPVAISFKDKIETSRILDESTDVSYFEQQFYVDRIIGSGSFGDVFRVKSKSDGRYYAVKKSRCPFKGKTDRDHKLKEVAKHEMIPKHPNLVDFIKAWEEKSYLYLQIELCECSLNEFIDRYRNMDINMDSLTSVANNGHTIGTDQSLPEELVWNFLIDLLMALSHLHDHDLIHLDIKPENIFISKGICKLGDFGLMVDLSQKEESDHAIEGDPKYMAKELMSGKFSKSADIFSLGVTMLEISCDINLPSGGEAWHDIRNGNIPFEYNRKISPQLRRIITIMMEPDPKDRPSAKEILNDTDYVKKIAKKRALKITFVEVSKILRNFFLLILHYVSLILFVDYLSDIIHTKCDGNDDSNDSFNPDADIKADIKTNVPISPIRLNGEDDFDDEDHKLFGVRPLLPKLVPTAIKEDRYQLRSRKVLKKSDPFNDSFEVGPSRKRSVTSPAIFESRNKCNGGLKSRTSKLPTINPSPVNNSPNVYHPCSDSPGILCLNPSKAKMSRNVSTPKSPNGTGGQRKKSQGILNCSNVSKTSSCYDFSDDEFDLKGEMLLEPNIGPKNLMSVFDQLDEEK